MSVAQDALGGSEAAVERTESTKRRSRARPYLILGLVVVGILLAYLALRALTAGRENTDDAQVAVDMVPISARVGGAVVSVPVVDNQAVKAGDLLARIDPADYENKLKLAEAELEAAKAQSDAADAQMRVVAANSQGGLSTARAALLGTTSSVAGAEAQITAARAAVAHAQAEADKADADLQRAQNLRKDDAIPQAQVDTMTAAAAAQHAGLAQSLAQLAAASEMRNTARSHIAEAKGRLEQNTPVEAQLAAAKANSDLAHAHVISAETNLAQARLNLSYTTIVAPIAGHISKLAVHTGQLVSPAQTITNVLPQTTYIVANFKETQVGEMRAGQVADVELDAHPGRSFRATVDSLAYGTGAQFSLLPPDNASGNFVKVVQRVPVKLVWSDLPSDVAVQAGLSADVTVHTK
jgi:membrane fusion protein (multidrug efflux system)